MQRYEALLPLQLKSLKLSTFNAHWQDSSNIAQNNNWEYSQYLSHLCELEMTNREQSRLARRIKESCLPKNKSISNINFTANTTINPAQIKALAESDTWVRQANNVIIFGPSGVGKTHIAAAIGYRQIEIGTIVKFYLTSHIVQLLQQAKTQFRLKDLLMKLDKIPLIILDDFGYIKKDEHETSVLFEFICHRYETGSLMITANQPFSEWDKIFPDNMMAVASIDRLVHHAKVISISGESYRMRNKKQTEVNN